MIYLDYHSTSPLDPRVLKVMMPYLRGRFGNPASGHALGREAAAAVEKARVEVARLIGAEAREIVFTSGATESNNLAIKGVAQASASLRSHIITVVTEHKSVLDPMKRLSIGVGAPRRVAPTYLGVGRDGLIDLDELERAITPRTALITIMAAHNEIGVIQPLAEIGRIVARKGVLFHTDAVQAAGRIPLDVKAMGIHLLSLSAHKFCGPKGVGALYVRKKNPRVNLLPLAEGGGQEAGLRSGTLNVPGIVGMGEACRLARIEGPRENRRLRVLRDRLLTSLSQGTRCVVNGSLTRRLSNNLNVSFERPVLPVKGVVVSAGSACLSTSPEPSYVLKALGVPENLRKNAVRFGLGRFTTKRDIDRAARAIIKKLCR